jgi:hypothetical protein
MTRGRYDARLRRDLPAVSLAVNSAGKALFGINLHNFRLTRAYIPRIPAPVSLGPLSHDLLQAEHP